MENCLISRLQWKVVEILTLDTIRTDFDSFDPTLRHGVVHAPTLSYCDYLADEVARPSESLPVFLGNFLGISIFIFHI